MEDYETIKSKLHIDTLRLTEELMELPHYQSDASEGAAEAQKLRDDWKDAVDQAKAEAAAILREEDAKAGNKPRGENRIESEIMLDRQVRDALAGLRAAEYDLARWQGLANSWRSKSSAIRAIADLIQAGYTTPQTLYSDRRTRMAEVRRRPLPSEA